MSDIISGLLNILKSALIVVGRGGHRLIRGKKKRPSHDHHSR